MVTRLPSEKKEEEEKPTPEVNEPEPAKSKIQEDLDLIDNGDSNAPTSFAPDENVLQDVEAAKYDYNDLDQNGNPKRSTELSKVVKLGGRVQVIANINGVNIPFYISTGSGGKKSVPTGKWYPYFNVGPDMWMNKGTEESINNFYGSPELRKMAQWLDDNLGDLREDKSVPVADSKTNGDKEFTKIAERHIGPGLVNGSSPGVLSRFADIVRKIRTEPTEENEPEVSEPEVSDKQKQNIAAWEEFRKSYRAYEELKKQKNTKRATAAARKELEKYPLVGLFEKLGARKAELREERYSDTVDPEAKDAIDSRIAEIESAEKDLQRYVSSELEAGNTHPTDKFSNKYDHLLGEVGSTPKPEEIGRASCRERV